MKILALFVIVLGAMFVYGFIRKDDGDEMRLNAIVHRRVVSVIVHLPNMDERYRWLSVRGCSAEMTESGTFCNGYWERESTMAVTGSKQQVIEWREVPPGLIRVVAMAFDSQEKLLAQAQLTIIRGE